MAAQLNGWVHGQHIPRVKIKIGEGWGREVGPRPAPGAGRPSCHR